MSRHCRLPCELSCAVASGRTAVDLCRRRHALLLIAGIAGIAISAAYCQAAATIVALSGTNSPDGNGQLVTFTRPSLNNGGQLAFYSQLTGTANEELDSMALYRASASPPTLIARQGVTQIGGSPLAGFVNFSPSINDAAFVSASATLTSPPNEVAAFLGNGGLVSVLPRYGTASPTGNNQLSNRSIPVINNAGVAAYHAIYVGASPETGIYSRASDGTVTSRLLEGTTAPHGGTIIALSTALPTLNESNQIGIIASANDEVFTNRVALRLDGTTPVELARNGDTAIGGTIQISNIVSTAAPINDSGQIAFAAAFIQPGTSALGIFRADGAGAKSLTPAILPGATTSAMNMHVIGINNGGTVAFETEFTGGGGDPLSGIYFADNAGAHTAALEDAAAPGGKFFRRFYNDSIAFNESGQIAFFADLSDTANGALSGKGIFVYDPATGLKSVVRTGDALGGSTVAGLNFAGAAYTATQSQDVTESPDPNFSGFNNAGQIAFSFALGNTQSGVAIWSGGSTPTAGDYNHDGKVDAADYTVWRDTLGSTTTLDADGDGSLVVDAGDFTVWKNNFGQGNGSGSGGASALQSVPEPASSSICLWALPALSALLARSARNRR